MTLERPAEMTSPPALDRGVLEDLREAVGDVSGEFISSIATVYEQQAVQLTTEIAAAAQDGDVHRLGLLAHSLKGSSANVGGKRLADLCAELEHWHGDPAELLPKVASLRAELAALRTELNQFVQPE